MPVSQWRLLTRPVALLCSLVNDGKKKRFFCLKLVKAATLIMGVLKPGLLISRHLFPFIVPVLLLLLIRHRVALEGLRRLYTDP